MNKRGLHRTLWELVSNFMKVSVYQEFWKQWDAQEQAEAAARFVKQEQRSLRSSKKRMGWK
jgi:hypothetical protein